MRAKSGGVGEDGERSAEAKAMVGGVVHTAGRWIEQKKEKRKIRAERDLMKEKMKICQMR